MRAAPPRRRGAISPAGEVVGIEDPHQQAGVGHRRPACRRGRSRPARGPSPRCRDRRARRRSGEIETMLPPPAPTLEISVESALMTRSCSSSKVLLTNGWPSTTSEMSVEVPPTSQQIRLRSPIARAERRARHRPRGGPGEDDPKRLLERLRPRQERRRAVGEVERAGEARRAQLGVELVRVAGEDQLHEDVDDGRRRARVLLRERRGLRGDRDRRRRAPRTSCDELAQAALVRVVDVGVDQADRDALDVAAREHLELGARLVLVEREVDAAVGEQPLHDAAAQVARHQRPRRVAERAPPRRVGLGCRRAPDAAAVEHVAVTLGGQEGDLRQGPGDDRVEPHRARVVEHLVARRCRGAARPRRPARRGRPRRSRPWSR